MNNPRTPEQRIDFAIKFFEILIASCDPMHRPAYSAAIKILSGEVFEEEKKRSTVRINMELKLISMRHVIKGEDVDVHDSSTGDAYFVNVTDIDERYIYGNVLDVIRKPTRSHFRVYLEGEAISYPFEYEDSYHFYRRVELSREVTHRCVICDKTITSKRDDDMCSFECLLAKNNSVDTQTFDVRNVNHGDDRVTNIHHNRTNW